MSTVEQTIDARLKEYQPETWKALQQDPELRRKWLEDASTTWSSVSNQEIKAVQQSMRGHDIERAPNYAWP